MMIIENEFNLTEKVFLVTDPDQLPRFVNGIVVRPNDTTYILVCGVQCTTHYAHEISREANKLMMMGMVKEEEE